MSKYQKYYNKRKAQLVEQAIDFQIKCADGECNSFMDVIEMQDYFRYWGKRFGLLREFEENAII